MNSFKQNESTRDILTPNIHPTLAELMQWQTSARKLQLRHYRYTGTSLAGNHLSPLKGRGMDFRETRRYQPGDDIRHMDWRVTARTGKPHTKMYQEEKERPVFFALDFNPGMFFGTRKTFKSTLAMHLTAILAWVALQNGDRVGGIISAKDFHLEIKPKGRLAGLLPLLKALVSLSLPTTYSQPQDLLPGLLKRVIALAPPGSLIMIISDYQSLSPETHYQLSYLSQHHDVIANIIQDPLELNLPSTTAYTLSDGQQDLTIDPSAKKWLAKFVEKNKQHQEALIQCFQQCQIPYLLIRTDESLMDTVMTAWGKYYD